MRSLRPSSTQVLLRKNAKLVHKFKYWLLNGIKPQEADADANAPAAPTGDAAAADTPKPEEPGAMEIVNMKRQEAYVKTHLFKVVEFWGVFCFCFKNTSA